MQLAILVDGDNAQPKLMEEIVKEVSNYGTPIIRRIYGDWTAQQMSCWQEVINKTAFTAKQVFAFIPHKNATDLAMVIDAMDILYSGKVDGFCIVSTDSDFTGLARRVREEGLFIMGIGEQNTPTSFVKACDTFTNCEILRARMELSTLNRNASHTNLTQKILDLISLAYDVARDKNHEVPVTLMGETLRKLDPTFDSKEYGFKTITPLLQELDDYVLKDNWVDGIYRPIVIKR